MQQQAGLLLSFFVLFHACAASGDGLAGEDEAVCEMSSASDMLPSKCRQEDRALLQSSRHTSLKAGDANEAEAPLSFFQMVVENSEESCGWTIYYGVFLDGFESQVYRHSDEHCLAACCEDPECVGVTVLSNGLSDCRRFVSAPQKLSEHHGRSVGDGVWLQNAPPISSIFMKGSTGHVAPVLQSAATPPPAIAVPQECQWEVHYNKWIKSFDGASSGRDGEYEHPGPYGGAHCLAECCKDPTCTALELLSSEKFQCYKYSSLPQELKGVSGSPLGDGEWLKHKATRWSIFVKVGGVQGSEKAPLVKVMATPWDFSLLAQCLGILMVLGGCVHLLLTERARDLLAAKLGLASTKPECKGLIETVRLDKPPS